MRPLILLVEDNAPLAENTAELLQLSGYDVASAINGAEALSFLNNSKPDLILSDIQMPVMSGYTFLEHVRSNSEFDGIKFIYFTARSENNEIRKGMALGADDYLVKPFSDMDLLQMIAKHLDRTFV